MLDVLLFGDQSVDVYPFLRKLLAKREHTTLVDSFLKHVGNVLRKDIADLPSLQRQQIPPLVNLREFVEAYQRAQCRNAIVDDTLLCIAQLAHYISLIEENPDALSADRSIIGMSTGLIAAAVVSAFPTGGSCVPLAVEAVRMAFRLGLHVTKVADRLSPSTQAGGHWAVIVSGISELVAQTALNEFHTDAQTSEPNVAYISATSSSTVTISGPPDRLEKLFSYSDALRNSHRLNMSINGPYHAPHLYNDATIDEIVGMNLPEVLDILKTSKPQVSIYSGSEGSYHPGSSTEGLFRQIVRSILINSEDLNLVLNECSDIISESQNECRIVPVGPNNNAASIISELEAKTSTKPSLFDWESAHNKKGFRSTGNLRNDKIAIVGMSGRFPGAEDVAEFWDVLRNGLDMHKEVPPDRFDYKTHYDPSGKGKNASHTPFGCFLENAGLFDPRFFNMSPREAAQTDPMQRLALITAFEALEMAGYVPNRTPATCQDRIGTFYGQTSDDWREINEAQDIDTYFITGGVRAFGPGRINYHFKFSGPSFNIDTACSSSMAAIQLACTSLWAGDCDTAIAGGLNVMTNPDIFAGLSKGQFLSKTGPCQTFDNDADGYCRGDGVGTIILKRLADAEADKDNILAVILSSATNHSAEAISITHPHDKTQETLYKKVLDQAGVDPLEISYVEMHGTGTQAGDDTEMRSVSNVFAPPHGRAPHQKLYLGSVKANIGHGEAASGVTALIKVLLMLRNSAIPPHVGIKKEMNHGFPDLPARNAHIAFQQAQLPRPAGGKRSVFINNFSAAGGNTAVVLEDGPIREITGVDSRKLQVVSVSARALSSFKGNMKNLLGYLKENPNVSLPSLSYTTMARRIHHSYRVAFAIADIPSLQRVLADVAETDIQPVPSSPRIAFTFTGQGSHYARLGGDLFDTSVQFREDILEFDAIATSLGFPSFIPLVDGSAEDVAALSPVLVQVGLTSIQIALLRLWRAWGVKPDVVIGHSLGEYAALNAADILSVTDTLYLVGSRAQLLESQCTAGSHAMLAVKSGAKDLQYILADGTVEIACINGPTETVLSGKASDVDNAKAELEKGGLKVTKLNVPYAFHSSQIEAILEDFERVASSVTYRSPTCAVLSPLLGNTARVGDIDEKYLCRHARETVNFTGALNAGREAQVINDQTVFVELGPHPVSLGFVKATFGPSVPGGHSLRRNESPWNSLASTATMLHNRGADIAWNEYHRDFDEAHELLELPAYSWSLKNYWIQYRNNWCITKGDDRIPSPADKMTLSTTNVQKVIEETYYDGKGRLVAESDVSRPDMYAAVSGHLVNGAALCPSSIYGDIAITVSEYMYRRLADLPADSEVPRMNVGSMEVPKPLIAKPDVKQVLKISAEADNSRGHIDVTFSSDAGEHAKCVVEYGNSADWLSEWQRTAYLVESRIQTLETQARESRSHVLLQGIAYKLFTALVDYEKTYQGMRRVILDGKNLEATAEVVLNPPKDGQNFVCAPYWIDSIGHLAGFVMNANDELDSKTNVYVSHGWSSLRFARPLEAGKQYRTYVRMMPIDGSKMVSGDVYLFDGSEVVGLVGGLKFQCIPRAVLDIMLPPAGGAARRPVVQEKKAVEVRSETVEDTAAEGGKTTKVVGKATAVTKTSTASITSRVLAIVADECGVQMNELADANSFADLGVDSLMQLAISSRMREDIEIEVSGTLFVDHPTVGALKAHLQTHEVTVEEPAVADISDSQSSAGSHIDSESNEFSRRSSGWSTGTDPSDVEMDETDFKGLEAKFQKLSEQQNPRTRVQCSESPSLMSSNSSSLALNIKQKPAPVKAARPPATSVLLQGSPRTATRSLFIFPDGGGSATSYVGIPDISSDLVVYGLNSPFMTRPEDFTCGLQSVAELYVNEIRRRQPKGPYNVGGWSAGGVIAFEGAQQLIRAGEEVERLILLDSPCPLTIEPLPNTLHQWFNSIGLLGDGDSTKVPAWLLPHFQASINALSTYSARMIDPSKAPKTFAIWCEDGVCKYPTDPRPEPYPYGHAQFLLENKTDFGPGLWDAMVGRENVFTSRVDGNHFTMMKQPHVQRLAEEIRKALNS